MAIRDDWIRRVIEEIAAMMAALIEYASAGDRDAALEEARKAYRALMADRLSMLEMIDAESLARLMGDDTKVLLLARVSAEEARVLGADDPAAARVRLARAQGLFRAAQETGDPELVAEVREVLETVAEALK